MADIFVSYASADRDRAKAFAEALATRGWSVWWDRTIPPGRQFDEVIEEELAAAGCVIVLWSKASVASSWVKTEAADARDRRILVPVLIEDVRIPLEFRRLQAADLTQWQAGPLQADELFRAIAAQLRRRGQPQVGAAEPSEPASSESPFEPPVGPERPRRPTRSAPSRRLLAAIGGGALAVALIVVYVAPNTGGRHAEERVAPQRTPERVSESTAPPVRAAIPAPPPSSDPPRVGAGSRPRPTPAPAEISGRWRDTTWGHVSQITQDGEAFHYSVWGAACRGTFQSSGSGTIRGNRVESTYRSTMPSQGRCSGTVSPDGTQIRSTCVDSVCGSFAASAVRQ